ncbi:hypothetical protein [Megasphaera sp. ASD88]|nr:hypothetical protein [Megasphaera sp. ASD88]
MKLHILPNELRALSEEERAFVYACCQEYARAEKKAAEEAKKRR